jgi:hypothetical protein
VNWIQLFRDREAIASSCEHGDEPWGSIKSEVFLDQLTAPWGV